MKRFILCFAILTLSTASFAAETWSNAERLKNRDAVVTGVVKSISKFSALASEEEVLVAEITVEKVVKNNELLKGDTIQVFYLDSNAKKDTYKGHVKLEKGQKADFYLDARPFFEDKNVLFIVETADVQKSNSSKS